MRNPPSQASRDLMKNFLSKTPAKRGRDEWAASPRPEQDAKRASQREEEDDSVQLEDMEEAEEEVEETCQTQLKKTMMEAAGLTPEQASICMKHIKKTFRERVAEEAKKIAKKVFKDEVEAAKCRRSILMHNADKWVAGDQLTQGYSLAERVTAAVHRIYGGMINVVDCFAVGAWQPGVLLSSVYLSFGSSQQKSTFCRIMANRIRFGNKAAQNIRVLACRDAVPKDSISDAKKLAQKGMAMRMNGKIASFRAVARDLGCIPVLEVRECTSGGQSMARWAVHQDTETNSTEKGQTAGEATLARGQRDKGEGEWQIAGGRKKGTGAISKTTAGDGAKNKGTPRKVAGVTSKLSVPQPGTYPPHQEEGEMEADIVRFSEDTDLDRHVEPY